MPNVLTHGIQCRSCLSVYRLEALGQSTIVHGGKGFCPNCGSDNTKRIHRTGDGDEYWWYLAESIGLPKNEKGANLARAIYESWPTDEFHKFTDYVASLEESPGEE